MSLTIIFTAEATSTGGRNGSVRSPDGVIDLGLTLPKAIGGEERPGRTTPEHLFAAGYAACFGSSVEHIARERKVDPGEVGVQAAVSMGARPEGGFGLQVALTVTLHGVGEEDARAIIAMAHQICPYSNALKGNVDVTITPHLA